MKKIFAVLAFFAFVGVATTPSNASVIDNIDQTVQVLMDTDNSVIADVDQDKDKDKKKKATKATTKSGECGSVKSGCGEAKEAGCASSCGEAKEGKETKKKTI